MFDLIKHTALMILPAGSKRFPLRILNDRCNTGHPVEVVGGKTSRLPLYSFKGVNLTTGMVWVPSCCGVLKLTLVLPLLVLPKPGRHVPSPESRGTR